MSAARRVVSGTISGLRVADDFAGAEAGPIRNPQLGSRSAGLAEWSAGVKSARAHLKTSGIHRINGDVGLVASVDGRGELRLTIGSERETPGEEDESLAAGHREQILGEASQGEKHAAGGEIGFRVSERSGGS